MVVTSNGSCLFGLLSTTLIQCQLAKALKENQSYLLVQNNYVLLLK